MGSYTDDDNTIKIHIKEIDFYEKNWKTDKSYYSTKLSILKFEKIKD